ncbi:alpha/beta hydrolase [Spirillospora sp. CA-294931]|uniref:alpha/beta hydrolase n=1 Tax=Spirillospora sp. CA-294931 TaxID=3240042 RepID=UPI003D901F66
MRIGSPASRRLAAIAGVVLAAALAGGPAAATTAPVPADDGARITEEKWVDPSTLDLTVDGPALGKPQKVRVLVPKGWSPTADRTWPVVYAYHGGNADYVSWTRQTDIEQIAARWDVMVVMPEGGKNGSYTDWWNDGAGGTPKWETFHIDEVVQLLERNYRAGTGRAALGISSGGQGAVTYAARRPGMFRYAVSLSGILHLTKPGLPSLLMLQGMGFDSDPAKIWGRPGRDDWNWAVHDPYLLAHRLRGTGLYISSGTTGWPGPLDDPVNRPWDENFYGATGEFIVGSTVTGFVEHLKRLGIPATTNIYGNGWHNWNYWRPELAKSWPLMMAALGANRT